MFIPPESRKCEIALEMALPYSQVQDLLLCPEGKGTGALSDQEPVFAQRTLKLLLSEGQELCPRAGGTAGSQHKSGTQTPGRLVRTHP